MQKFEYRTPRYSVDLPVRFSTQNLTVTGRCKEISKDGLTLELSESLPTDSSGIVSISFQDHAVSLPARIVHPEGTRAGLEFHYASEVERNAVTRLIESLTNSTNPPRPILLK
jgi:hypothetical protein